MEKVVDLDLQGNTPAAIAKQLKIGRLEVKKLLEDYRLALSQDVEARDLARDYLFKMSTHFDKLINIAYDHMDNVNMLDFNHQVAGRKAEVIKLIAELEAKRLDAMQKAGLLDAADTTAEIKEIQDKQSRLIDIIRSQLCPSCRNKVAYELSKITGQAEVVSVEVVD